MKELRVKSNEICLVGSLIVRLEVIKWLSQIDRGVSGTGGLGNRTAR